MEKEEKNTSLGNLPSEDEEAEILNEATTFLNLKNGDCVVGCRFGKTLNIGNYESMRVDFWQARNCNIKEAEKTMVEVQKFTRDKIKTYIDLIKTRSGR